MKQTTCALYLRVSTTDKGQDTDNQLLQLKEFCERQGWQIANIYIDRVSGRKGKRERGNFSRSLKMQQSESLMYCCFGPWIDSVVKASARRSPTS
ncbi:recombinase family protein [Trichocoleus sp. FACHB-591]|nr:recombinase family protein [Trichocoleus sp. FACHB-591]MBD2095098.1 recombinase family protein [Trichocoleus sp. FACHB-591]